MEKNIIWFSEQKMYIAHLKIEARCALGNLAGQMPSCLTIWVRLEKVFDVLQVQVLSGKGRSSR
ncbi:MAG: hypothetical protein IAF94_01805 [Pirellulaceae bacterium]|nr:hypothetical protein [Pirellulaceae bacterium]